MSTTTSETKLLSHGLLWFGAALSIAEIFTGTLFAPLGFEQGVTAILLGHIIGGLLFFLAGLIGANTRRSAMETVRIGFGRQGASGFALANVLQLIGWTTVMIITGAAATNAILPWGTTVWSLIIGGLIILWLVLGYSNLTRLNLVAVGLLFCLTIWLSFIIFDSTSAVAGALQLTEYQGLSFGAAVELSAAMPLSWLPLVSDYTRTAKRPVAATVVSTLTYTIVSIWMYVIGLGSAIYAGETDIAAVMLKTGLGLWPLLIIIFATVTTTYLDAFSAGVSLVSIFQNLSEKTTAIALTVLGIILAIFVPMTEYENFLFLIGSVFTPMIAILFTQYFLLKQDASGRKFYLPNLILWLVGFILYRNVMTYETPLGTTFPVMIVIAVLTYIVGRITGKIQN
ncbi:MAG: putative hydroxymethylpyrimidine transporter CytX [Veillonella sp.]|uniref:putative hydroxymethylpyrimidine transporter CytX n=1 Tax=Veillonella sp. TaxID=1926307 RepID=UPI0025FBE8B1|nr:putative hydroxymethylpyrimidine transporter CytX [Veillonella sp.]MBE6079281.1 putative hydroxymethylpyrimidine transporter CytX [Veillonella sp.]